MKDILLIGGGGHCKSVIDVIEQDGTYRIAGIIDKPELLGKKTLGYEIIGSDDNLSSLIKKYKYALITVGQLSSPEVRKKLFILAKEVGFSLPCIISPRAYVSSHASITEGSVILHDAILNASSCVGSNCIINTKAIIEHDVIIHDHCHVSTGAIVNGGTTIGEGTFIGSNAVTKEAIRVPANSFIKAGSIVK